MLTNKTKLCICVCDSSGSGVADPIGLWAHRPITLSQDNVYCPLISLVRWHIDAMQNTCGGWMIMVRCCRIESVDFMMMTLEKILTTFGQRQCNLLGQMRSRRDETRRENMAVFKGLCHFCNRKTIKKTDTFNCLSPNCVYHFHYSLAHNHERWTNTHEMAMTDWFDIRCVPMH